ncbi:MAG: CotH kinase family protein [Bacteroidetes bacterium]|nr:CotH kinase family protein [Bacteroidota bacterium]MBK9801049.1 CotH kinase family protein [Bacteroidota bacterium]MBP6412767.1 CotH kinase family protein [Bacteroidia bacterium]
MKYQLIAILLFLSHFSSAQSLVINEVQASNKLGIVDEDNDNVDWIEIYNAGTDVVSLLGLALSDDSTQLLKWILPNRTLAPGEFILVFASGKDRKMGFYLHSNFTLNSGGETVYLSDPSKHVINKLKFPPLNDNVSYGRKLDGSAAAAYFQVPSPRSSNNGITYYEGNLLSPDFSLPAGYYSDTITLFIDHADPGVSVRYTLDGSEPTSNSPLVNGPIKLTNRSTDPNYFSMIPTNPGLDLTKPNFDTSKSDTRGWLPPYGNVFKINVVKAKAFKSNMIASRTKTRSYIIDPLLEARFNFPVISISTDEGNLFDNDTGIYVYGNVRPNDPFFEGNYSYNSDEWARNIYLEYFEKDGSLAFDRYVKGEMNGNGGRHAPQKSIRLSSRSIEGRELFKYKFFDEKEIAVFDKLVLRNGGHRPDCFPRDNLGDRICEGLKLEVPNYKLVTVFIDGEYWGIQCIKERFDDAYFQYNYNIKSENFVMVELKGTLTEGNEGDEDSYLQLVDFVSSADMNNTANYEYAATQMDLENYMDFIIAESYIGNIDFPNNNTRYWRKKTAHYEPNAAYGHDGRWRWVIYDMDGGFGASCGKVASTFGGLKRATSAEPDYEAYTRLIRGLLTNSTFQHEFINRYADVLNSTFSASVVSAKIADEENKLSNDILEHVRRWGYPSIATTLPDRYLEIPSLTKWNSNMTDFLQFAHYRPVNDRIRLMEKFPHLTDTARVTLNVNNKNQGEIQINSIRVNAKLDGINSTVYPWKGIYFEGNPISLTAIPKPGYKFVNWTGTQSGTNNPMIVNLSGNSSFTAVFAPDTNFKYRKSIVINEINSTNKNVLKDPYNENDDWIELYNPTNYPVDLEGYYLTDQFSNLTKYTFPSGSRETIIEPKGFLLIWADHQENQGILHTPFKLRSSGEVLILVAPDGNSIVDSLSFTNIPADVSYGRLPNGSDNFVQFNQPSPKASNSADLEFTPPVFVENFVIYPNPLTDSPLYFTKETDVRLYSVQGQLLLQQNGVKQIDVSFLPQGIYYLKSADSQTAKLVKL